MSVPDFRWDAFLDLARSLDCVGVEFRNDLNAALFDGHAPAEVRRRAQECDLRILAVAEVKAFNDWSDERRAEAEALMRIAADCGAEAVSLIPRNDGLGCGNGERQANLRLALRELRPMLDAHGLIGLIEPLGFEICSLRYKAEAVDAIEALDAAGSFRLVHDTFHHTLAGGGPIFAAHTGIVHISGVTDGSLALSEMRDAHRVLVDAEDRLGNIAQVEELQSGGYGGPVSFEPFAPSVHALADPGRALAGSFQFITSRLAEKAA